MIKNLAIVEQYANDLLLEATEMQEWTNAQGYLPMVVRIAIREAVAERFREAAALRYQLEQEYNQRKIGGTRQQ